MRLALDQAKAALLAQEVPVGCVFIKCTQNSEAASEGGDLVVAYGRNETNRYCDATKHAEIVGILLRLVIAFYLKVKALERYFNQDLSNFKNCDGVKDFKELNECDLYVTCEPCIMCAHALNIVGIRKAFVELIFNFLTSRLGKVYYGCKNEKFGGCGSVEAVNGSYAAEGGILADDAIRLFQTFYARPNENSARKRKLSRIDK